MTISIVVPVYNAEQFLERAIQSVLNQTDNNWELILVDDGSTDASGKLCDKYAQKYLNIHSFHKKNEGQFLTRQFGIQKATGEYIGFLDADDFLDEEYIYQISKNIFENAYPDIICFEYSQWNKVVTKHWRIVSPNSGITLFDNQIKRQYVYKQIINGTLTGSMCSKVIKKSLLTKIAIKADVVKNKRFAEDAYHSFSIIAKASSILFLPLNLYFYYNNNKSASQQFDMRPLDYFNQRYLFALLVECLELWGMKDENNLNQVRAFCFNYTVNYILKYYRSAKDNKRRKEIVNYDWSTYLLDITDDEINNNPYIRKSYITVWYAFKHKRHLEIFARERIKKIGWG